MPPMELKYMVQIELEDGFIINKEIFAINPLEATDKAYAYAKNRFKKDIVDIKVV